jgi:regulator-associated protein of mTOR
MALLLESPFARLDSTSLHLVSNLPPERQGSPHSSGSRTRVPSLQSPQLPYLHLPASSGNEKPQIKRANSTITPNTIKRTSSFANALKALPFGISFPSYDESRSSASLASAFLPGRTRSDRQDKVDVTRPPSPNMNVAQYSSPYSQPSAFREENRFDYHLTPSSHSIHSQFDFSPVDVMEALFEEDMERLRARRKAGMQSRRHHVPGSSLASPSNSTFSVDSNGSVILGLGTGVGIRDVLPLKSKFYDWCAEYFKEPQMRVCCLYYLKYIVFTFFDSKRSRTKQAVCSTITKFGDRLATNRSPKTVVHKLQRQASRHPRSSASLLLGFLR